MLQMKPQIVFFSSRAKIIEIMTKDSVFSVGIEIYFVRTRLFFVEADTFFVEI